MSVGYCRAERETGLRSITTGPGPAGVLGVEQISRNTHHPTSYAIIS